MKSVRFFAATATIVACTCTSLGSMAFAQGRSNPIDRVSNPSALDFANVDVGHREFRAPFIRDGVVTEPQRFAAIKREMTQSQISALLGEPLRAGEAQGREWNYNFKFKLPQSNNYLVCQYKVLFDGRGLVNDTVWRRRQCEQLAASGQATK